MASIIFVVQNDNTNSSLGHGALHEIELSRVSFKSLPVFCRLSLKTDNRGRNWNVNLFLEGVYSYKSVRFYR